MTVSSDSRPYADRVPTSGTPSHLVCHSPFSVVRMGLRGRTGMVVDSRWVGGTKGFRGRPTPFRLYALGPSHPRPPTVFGVCPVA